MIDKPKFSTAPYEEPDHNKRKRKGAVWCPYCGEWRVYQRNPWGTKSCPDCTVSDNDFWVKSVNKIWGFSIRPRGRGGGDNE